jgi:hypothetical protein
MKSVFSSLETFLAQIEIPISLGRFLLVWDEAHKAASDLRHASM